MCGGNLARNPEWINDPGLSPRVRGKPGRTLQDAGLAWSIPACAGETHLLGLLGYLLQVYPRVCGGNTLC